MATGFGKQGTSEEDIQRITGALYTRGVISGAVVTRSPTGLTYSVSAGVVCMQLSNGLNVLAPVPVHDNTLPAYVGKKNRLYAIHDAQNNVIVNVTNGDLTIPAGGVLLGAYDVPASATNTNAASPSTNTRDNVDYSIPYAATGMSLWQHSYSHNGPLTQVNLVRSGDFYVPTDRAVDICIVGTFDTVGGDGSVYYNVEFDGITVTNMGTGKLSNWYGTHYLQDTIDVAAGKHSVRITMSTSGDAANIYMRTGATGPEQSNRPGTKYKLRDAGIVI